MTNTQLQNLFQEFAMPLFTNNFMKTKQDTVLSFAKSLWVAMIAGEKAEEEFWKAMEENKSLPQELIQSAKKYYVEEMKPAVSKERLEELRKRYGIAADIEGR